MKTFTLVLVFIILIESGYSVLHCWECDGQMGECGSVHLKSKYRRICHEVNGNQSIYATCMKIIFNGVNDTTARSCHYYPRTGKSDDYCLKIQKENPEIDCTVCDDHYCNSSQQKTSLGPLIFILLSFVVAYLYNYD